MAIDILTEPQQNLKKKNFDANDLGNYSSNRHAVILMIEYIAKNILSLFPIL